MTFGIPTNLTGEGCPSCETDRSLRYLVLVQNNTPSINCRRTPAEDEKHTAKLLAREKAKRKKLAALGIDYDFPGFTASLKGRELAERPFQPKPKYVLQLKKKEEAMVRRPLLSDLRGFSRNRVVLFPLFITCCLYRTHKALSAMFLLVHLVSVSAFYIISNCIKLEAKGTPGM